MPMEPISADGNLTLGDAATDTVSFSADINSNFIPDANVTFDLGSTTQHWANLYSSLLEQHKIQLLVFQQCLYLVMIQM